MHGFDVIYGTRLSLVKNGTSSILWCHFSHFCSITKITSGNIATKKSTIFHAAWDLLFTTWKLFLLPLINLFHLAVFFRIRIDGIHECLNFQLQQSSFFNIFSSWCVLSSIMNRNSFYKPQLTADFISFQNIWTH